MWFDVRIKLCKKQVNIRKTQSKNVGYGFTVVLL